MKAKLAWLLGIGLVVALVVWVGREEPLQVTVAEVEQGPVESTVANTRAGTVKACRRSKLSMPIGGVVDALHVTEGDRVEKDELLLSLWNADQRAQVDRAEARAEATLQQKNQACLLADLNEREAARKRSLLKRELASEEEVDRAETAALSQRQACEAAIAQVGVARAELDLQREVLERSYLRAPFAGVVAEVNGEVGEYITPSPPGVPTPPAIDLIDDACLYVTAPIDEVDARHLQVGLPVRVTLDAYRDEAFDGRITRIAPYVLDLEKQARTVDVDVRIEDTPADVHLLVGYSADITVILERRESTLRIPTDALVDDRRVWTVADGLAKPIAVEIGLRNWSFAEVRGGLVEGQRIIRNPDVAALEEGAEVLVKDD